MLAVAVSQLAGEELSRELDLLRVPDAVILLLPTARSAMRSCVESNYVIIEYKLKVKTRKIAGQLTTAHFQKLRLSCTYSLYHGWLMF